MHSMHPETASYLLGPPLHEKKSAVGYHFASFVLRRHAVKSARQASPNRRT